MALTKLVDALAPLGAPDGTKNIGVGTTTLQHHINDSMYPYNVNDEPYGLVINAALFNTMLSMARLNKKPLTFRQTDVIQLDTSLVIDEYGADTEPGETMVIDFNGARIMPLVDDLICFKVSREHLTIRSPRFYNPEMKQGVWAFRLGYQTEQVPGDPSNIRISTSDFKLYDATCYNYYGFVWSKPAASINGEMVNGAMVNGTPSGSYYSHVSNARLRNVHVGFWFDTCVTNDNQSTRWQIENVQHLVGNVTFKCDNVDGLRVIGGATEFIRHYPNEPLAVPTVVYIPTKGDPNSIYINSDNKFHGLVCENQMRNYDLGPVSEGNTSFVDCVFMQEDTPSIATPHQLRTTVEGDLLLQTRTSGNNPELVIWNRADNKSVSLTTNQPVPTIQATPERLGVPGTLKTFNASLKLGHIPNDTEHTYAALDYLDFDFTLRNARGYGFCFSQRDDNGNDVAVGSGRNAVFPYRDNTMDIGKPSARWANVYAGTGSINTSDERYKIPLEVPDDVQERERKAALEIKASIYSFTFKDAVSVKGQTARVHFGVGAQTVASILRAHGLVPEDYAFWCYDEWEDSYSDVYESYQELDASGRACTKSRVVGTKLDVSAGSRYGIRYDELSMFILKYL